VQRKNLAEQLECQSNIYQAIVAKGTAAYVFSDLHFLILQRNTELEALITQQNQLHAAAVELWNQAKSKSSELNQATEEVKSLTQLIKATTEVREYKVSF
jgi:hypothetical protein